jgi:hypothetical protein
MFSALKAVICLPIPTCSQALCSCLLDRAAASCSRKSQSDGTRSTDYKHARCFPSVSHQHCYQPDWYRSTDWDSPSLSKGDGALEVSVFHEKSQRSTKSLTRTHHFAVVTNCIRETSSPVAEMSKTRFSPGGNEV